MTRCLIIFLLAIIANIACNNKEIEGKESISNSYYTCPMHPTVVSKNPGSCPVCNMTLVLVNKKDTTGKIMNGNFISLDKQNLILAGVITDTVKYLNINNSDFLTGITVQDPENSINISSRSSGRIEKLFVNTEGEYIEKGMPLYNLYSEKIIALQKEFIEILKNKDIEKSTQLRIPEFIDDSKNRLLNVGLKPEQIDEIIKTHKIFKFITYFAENTGYISELEVTENMYIDEGQTLFNINSSSDLIVEAKLFENINYEFLQTKNFNIITQENSITIYKGVLVLVEPVMTGGNRYSLLKIRIKNSDKKLIQGMQVKVYAQKPLKKVIAIPKKAIVYGKTKFVWKYVHENTFEQTEINTGDEDSDNAEIVSGLLPGDIIITKGSYLVNSEFLLRKY